MPDKEKQASSEIAQSRERFRKFLVDQQWPFSRQAVIAAMEWAEGDTRERCAQIAEGIAGTEPDGVFEAGYDCGARMAAERIRGKGVSR